MSSPAAIASVAAPPANLVEILEGLLARARAGQPVETLALTWQEPGVILMHDTACATSHGGACCCSPDALVVLPTGPG